MCGLTVRTRACRRWLGKGCILPRCIPTTKEAFRPLWNPGAGRDPAPAKGAFGAPLEPIDQRAIPPFGNRTKGFSRPSTHDQSFRALDNEQAAFMPLHPDEGNPSPLDPTTRRWPDGKEARIDRRHAFTAPR